MRHVDSFSYVSGNILHVYTHIVHALYASIRLLPTDIHGRYTHTYMGQ